MRREIWFGKGEFKKVKREGGYILIISYFRVAFVKGGLTIHHLTHRNQYQKTKNPKKKRSKVPVTMGKENKGTT